MTKGFGLDFDANNPETFKNLSQEELIEKLRDAAGRQEGSENSQFEIDYDKYIEFVDLMTSKQSKNNSDFIERLQELDDKGVNFSRLMTAAVGINAEGGEFMEIVKKIAFQGKDWTPENRRHLIIELGDVMWYIAQACISLGVRLEDVVWENTQKLMKRYPEGTFDVIRSEYRKEGDI